MSEVKTKYWAFHYHIYKFLETTRDIELARQRYDRDKADYFWNWMKHNEEMDEKIQEYISI
jgi:hypothetical protein